MLSHVRDAPLLAVIVPEPTGNTRNVYAVDAVSLMSRDPPDRVSLASDRRLTSELVPCHIASAFLVIVPVSVHPPSIR